MYGVHSYEEVLKDPYLGIIDWEYIISHPEAKLAIKERYLQDPTFKNRIDEKKSASLAFKLKFETYFLNLNKSR